MFRKYTKSFLNDFDLGEIISRFNFKKFLFFEKNSFIYFENDPVTKIYFILSGEVEVLKSSGKEHKSLYSLGAGDLIGLDDALNGRLHTGSAHILKATNTVSVDKKDFLKFLKDHNEFNLWILKYLSCRINSLA